MLASVVPGTVWCRYGQCPSCVLADTIPCSNRTMLDAEWLLLRLISFCRAHQRQSTHTHSLTHTCTHVRLCVPPFVQPPAGCLPSQRVRHLGAQRPSKPVTWGHAAPDTQPAVSEPHPAHQPREGPSFCLSLGTAGHARVEGWQPRGHPHLSQGADAAW